MAGRVYAIARERHENAEDAAGGQSRKKLPEMISGAGDLPLRKAPLIHCLPFPTTPLQGVTSIVLNVHKIR